MGKNKELPINKISKHFFTHGNYSIIWKKPRGCDGACGGPGDRRIWLNPNIKTQKKFLKLVIDESTHACCWPIDNDYVYDMSTRIANFLWKLGFRLQPNKQKKCK